jgi:hypothetical protein
MIMNDAYSVEAYVVEPAQPTGGKSVLLTPTGKVH